MHPREPARPHAAEGHHTLRRVWARGLARVHSFSPSLEKPSMQMLPVSRSARLVVAAAVAASFAAACSGSPVEPRATVAPSQARGAPVVAGQVGGAVKDTGGQVSTSGGTESTAAKGPVAPWY